MKMVLLITNKQDVTVDFIVQELKSRRCSYFRLNTEDIPECIDIAFSINQHQYLLYDKKKDLVVNLSDVSSVYYRRPRISDLNYIVDISKQERIYLRSELTFMLDGVYKTLREAFWINDVFRIREAENKIYQLQLAKEIGFNIPDSIITNKASTVTEFFSRHISDYIIKPIKSGNICPQDGSKIIFTSQIEKNTIDRKRLVSFPIYIQNKIEKAFDIRCIVVKDKVYAAKIDSQGSETGKVDWRRSENFLPHERIQLPKGIQEKAINLTERLGLVFSAIDLVLDKEGNFIFLECNPNGQWAWIEKRLGYSISKSIVDTLLER